MSSSVKTTAASIKERLQDEFDLAYKAYDPHGEEKTDAFDEGYLIGIEAAMDIVNDFIFQEKLIA